MGFCKECESTCFCGNEYSHMSKKDRVKLASVVLGIYHEDITDKINDIIPEKHPMFGGENV